METDAVIDATFHLGRLRAELIGRGWSAELRSTDEPAVLHVRNPVEAAMRDQVVCHDEVFHWAWGGPVGPVSDVTGAADRIVFVLREITS